MLSETRGAVGRKRAPRLRRKALILVTPVGKDATTCRHVEEGLDPKRTVAVDTLFPMVKRRTIMGTPIDFGIGRTVKQPMACWLPTAYR